MFQGKVAAKKEFTCFYQENVILFYLIYYDS